jgi:hypothetical protein
MRLSAPGGSPIAQARRKRAYELSSHGADRPPAGTRVSSTAHQIALARTRCGRQRRSAVGRFAAVGERGDCPHGRRDKGSASGGPCRGGERDRTGGTAWWRTWRAWSLQMSMAATSSTRLCVTHPQGALGCNPNGSIAIIRLPTGGAAPIAMRHSPAYTEIANQGR